jgi:hypothetical protein
VRAGRRGAARCRLLGHGHGDRERLATSGHAEDTRSDGEPGAGAGGTGPHESDHPSVGQARELLDGNRSGAAGVLTLKQEVPAEEPDARGRDVSWITS